MAKFSKEDEREWDGLLAGARMDIVRERAHTLKDKRIESKEIAELENIIKKYKK